MAKNNRRYRKRKRKRRRQLLRRRCDTHHIFYMEKYWGHGVYGVLRKHHYCMVPIPRDTLHRYIHQNLGNIPVPDEFAVEEALKQLYLLEEAGVLHDTDPIEKRLRLLAALFDGMAQTTTIALLKQLDIVYKFRKEPP